MLNNQLISDGEVATFVKLEENIITVETEEFEYDFELTKAQLEQCYQQLCRSEEPEFLINAEKGIIIFETEYTVKQQSEIDSIADYFFSIEDMNITTVYCTVEKMYDVQGKKYADIITENNEQLTVYLRNDIHDLILDQLKNSDSDNEIENIHFKYSPEFHKIVFNDMSGFDSGDLQLGNMFVGEDGEEE
ncbi:hypothetical protein [Staphylococcus gallinarum]|uniref:hypothetical protein n=1 Tax=Staphylococcus gallinarum TaxID=1293 RepID=UPI002DB5EF21|nr:hypothetical protein [Staphylococcus gallinarum]MEB7040106.1 hypothetical protein [Staphylococcus gallinarum]